MGCFQEKRLRETCYLAYQKLQPSCALLFDTHLMNCTLRKTYLSIRTDSFCVQNIANSQRRSHIKSDEHTPPFLLCFPVRRRWLHTESVCKRLVSWHRSALIWLLMWYRLDRRALRRRYAYIWDLERLLRNNVYSELYCVLYALFEILSGHARTQALYLENIHISTCAAYYCM